MVIQIMGNFVNEAEIFFTCFLLIETRFSPAVALQLKKE